MVWLSTILSIFTLFLVVICYGYKLKLDSKERMINESQKCLEELTTAMDHLERQRHEYKNHINVLMAMVKVYNYPKEYESAAWKYIGYELPVSTCCMNMFRPVGNSMVESALFLKFSQAGALGLDTCWKAPKHKINESINPQELNEIICCLIDNAIEATQTGDKLIVHLSQNNNRLTLDVKNRHSALEDNALTSMFKKGFSTKEGAHRGIGLYNVSKIAKKYNGDFCAKNEIIDEENFVAIRVILRDKGL